MLGGKKKVQVSKAQRIFLMATQKTWEAFASTILLSFVLLKSFCFSPCWSLKKKISSFFIHLKIFKENIGKQQLVLQ